ncbi:MAG: hypothetical protein FD177_1900 [Desulfovibrionaceae bacterium]|nr:MAG: hypothetical protein FD177_1900 [Desulfovibrionaceae bacterium]
MPKDSDMSTLARDALFESLDHWRVSDSRFAKAYGLTGDGGRALLKTCIAALYQAGQQGALPMVSSTSVFHDGTSRTENRASRPWFALVLDPAVAAPAQVLAALLPAVCRRIPLVAVIRPRSRTVWPAPVLTALELCGIEQVLEPSGRDLGQCLAMLRSVLGPGGVACLGSAVFWSGARAVGEDSGAAHWLKSPDAAGLLVGEDLIWNREALKVAHAGVEIREYTTPQALDAAGHDAVFAPAGLAPATASLVLEPGREVLWDWPDMPGELFFARRLVYS